MYYSNWLLSVNRQPRLIGLTLKDMKCCLHRRKGRVDRGTYSNWGFSPLNLLMEIPHEQAHHTKTIDDAMKRLGNIKKLLWNTSISPWEGVIRTIANHSKRSQGKQEFATILVDVIESLEADTGPRGTRNYNNIPIRCRRNKTLHSQG